MTDCRLLCISFFAVSFVVDVISFATTYWYTIQNEDINGGLWQVCVNGSVCVATPADVGGAFHGVQALMTLGFISAILGVIAAASLCAGVSDTKLRILGISSLVAGVLTVAGAGVFDGHVDLDGNWSVILAYFAGVVYMLLVPIFLARRTETYRALP